MRAAALLLAAFVAGAALAFSGAQGGRDVATATGPLLGVVGNVDRFRDQTDQDSLVHQAFLGWGQGQVFGARFAILLPTLGPIPMLHLGTAGLDKNEVISPGSIAAGKGDGYLIALNNGIAAWGKGIYIRPMAEMNRGGNLYSAYTAGGAPKDAAHSTASYKKAFARIYVILHGGTADEIDAKLKALGLPPLAGGDLPENPFPTLRVVWSPLTGGNPQVAGNAVEQYYPGAAYVDVEGADIYDERLTDTAPWSKLDALFAHASEHHKPFSVPEWGLYGIDDPAFVKHMCTFLDSHPKTEVAVFYEASPGSIFDLGPKPKSREEYKRCLTPMGGPLPSWATTGAVTVKELTLTPKPPDGASAPLAVQFQVKARLSVPIVHWEVLYGDGEVATGDGQPPATLPHVYKQGGAYQALLFVFQGPPFDLEQARFLTTAAVTVGKDPKPRVAFEPSTTAGKSPLKVSFKIELNPPTTIKSWTFVYGDGNSRTGTGAPPHFAGHTYTSDGAYTALLLLNASGGRVFASTANITAGSPGGGGGGGGGSTTTTTTTTTAAPPATGRATGTVLVNGRRFTTGQIPYNARVDVTKGSLVLTTDTGTLRVFTTGGITAIFQLVRGTDKGQPIVELRLVGGNFNVCPKRKKSSAGRAAAPKTVRQLWGDGKGKFRTRGRYASATVRGTYWLTADRCDGTFVRVRRGRIQVADFPKRTQVTIGPGRTYLAKP